MAGDVTVYSYRGDLLILGDQHDNVIEVYRLSSGKTRVAGVDTKINGRTYQDFWLTDDLMMNMPKGDNDVSFRNYNGGIQADLVDLAMSVEGDDRLNLTGLHARGDVRIKTLGGDDSVLLSNSSVGTSIFDHENLVINTGDGEDEVLVSNAVIFGDVLIHTYDDPSVHETDYVEIQHVTVFDDLGIGTGSGRDFVTMQFSTIMDNVVIGTSRGSDVVRVDENRMEDLTIDAGSGFDDYVVVSDNSADNVRLTCTADGYSDVLIIFGNDFDSVTETNWDLVRHTEDWRSW